MQYSTSRVELGILVSIKLRVLNIYFTFDEQHCNTVVMHQSVKSCALSVVVFGFTYLYKHIVHYSLSDSYNYTITNMQDCN